MTSAIHPLPVSPFGRPRVFGAHPFRTDGDLLALAFAADGSLWSIEDSGVLRHWDPETRQQLGFFALDEIATVWAFSPAARLVAAGCDEATVWEVCNGQLRASWPQAAWVTAVAFPHALDPADERLATGHDDGSLRLWDMASEEEIGHFRGPAKAISALAFSPDGTCLAVASEDKLIRIWNIGSGRLQRTLVGHTDRVPALAWTPDGRRLISAGWDTTARVWDVDSGEPVILLNSHANQVLTQVLSSDGLHLACADSDRAIHLWDAERHRTRKVLRAPDVEVRCLAFSLDGLRLAAGGSERIVHVWDAWQDADSPQTTEAGTARTAVAVSPDGRCLTSLGDGTPLRFWDTSTGAPLLEAEGNPKVRAFAASPDARWVAGSVTAEDGREVPEESGESLRLWDGATGRLQARLEGQAGPVTALTFSPNSRLLATAGCRSADVWLWQVPGGEPALLIPGAIDSCAVEALAFHPGGRLLAAGGIDHLATSGRDGAVAIWDVHTPRRLEILSGGVIALAFSPDGSRLAGVSLKQTIQLWDTEPWRRLRELSGHIDAVTCVAFSPDGLLLASGSDDRTVRIWDAATGSARGRIELDTQVKALAFAPDGRSLFTGNGNSSCYQVDLRQAR
jgi:WD40 repeat protein